MSHSSPTLAFGQPILRPAKFNPKRVWTDSDYIYRYDPERRICKRSPINPQVFTGSMFFVVDRAKLLDGTQSQPRLAVAATASGVDAAAKPLAAPLLRSPFPPAARLLLAALWAIGLIAAAVFIYPLWPAVAYEVQQLHPAALGATTATSSVPATTSGSTAAPAAVGTANRLIIPQIGINTAIVEGPSLKVLDQAEGVWHQTGSAAHGNLVLAGHRFKYLPPNTTTLYNLNKLQVGDVITLDWLGRQINYHVIQMEVVPASDVAILNPTKTPRLTLYSCNDILMTKRVVAIAVPSK
ncbi:MAG TPA: sortase [Candidatus Saccharimonadales bacterium]|nr:sortase [Candidatus Saccharimonadales bacterium]